MEKALATTLIAGQTSSEPEPCLQLMLNNEAANKLDLYCQAHSGVRGLGGSVDTQASTMRMTLTGKPWARTLDQTAASRSSTCRWVPASQR